MGIFNEHSSSSSDTISSGVQGPPGPQGPPGIGFNLDANNNFNLENKKLINVKPGTNNNDVVTKSQIQYLDGVLPAQVTKNKAVIYSPSGSVHTNDLYLKDQYDQEVHVHTEDQDLNQCRLYVPNLKNNDSYGGRLKSDIMVTSIDQTIPGKKIFHDIEVPTPTIDGHASNKAYVDNEISKISDASDNSNYVKKSGDTMLGSLIVPKDNYPVQGDLNKVISYEAQREIFLSKKEGGRMEQPLDMNGHSIDNLPLPTAADHACSKRYVDTNFLNQLSGGKIGGDLDMRGHSIKYLKLDKTDHCAARVAELNLKADKIYVDSEISKIDLSGHVAAWVAGLNLKADKRALNDYLKLDGSVSMTGNLDLGMNKISNLKLPTNDTDAANKIYIDKTLSESHLIASSKKNEFTYLDDPDDTSSEYNITVNGFIDFNQSPHKNKKGYSITLQKDAGTNNYRSRMGFNLYPLPLGAYTMIFEFFPPTITNIQLSVQASEAYIHKSVQRDFSNYSKMLVQINNNSKITPDYIYLTMHGTSTTLPVNAHLIVYGIKDWSDNVTPEIYDHQIFEEMFEYDNGDMKMNTDLDMNNHKIENLDDPLNEGDACNKRSLNIVETKINDLSHYTKDYIYRNIFGNDFYDLEETSTFNLVQGVSGVVINGLRPNLVLGTDRFINSYSPKYGLQLSTKTHIRTVYIFNQNTSFTFFMSFLHDTTKTCEISWSNTLSLHVKFYPRYQITNNKLIIEVLSKNYETIFTSDFQNKQNFIWICYDSSKNLHKFSLGNYSSRVQQTFIAPVNFQSRQLEIDFDGYVKKVGLIDKFIDIDSLEFHKILLEEKRNGAYLE